MKRRTRTHIKIACLHLFFAAVVAISVRHYFIPGDILWTNEGDYLSWHMLLRTTKCVFQVRKNNGKWEFADFSILSNRQRAHIDKPVLLLSFLKQTACANSREVNVKAMCASATTSPAPLFDETKNICQAEFKLLGHNDWITLNAGPYSSPSSQRSEIRNSFE